MKHVSGVYEIKTVSKVRSLLGASIGFADLAVFSHKKDSIFGRISEFLLEKKYFRHHNEIFIHEKI